MSLALIGSISPAEILVIAVVALLVFGRRLPDVARSLGHGVSEFKRGLQGINEDVRQADATPALASPSEIAPSAPPQDPAA